MSRPADVSVNGRHECSVITLNLEVRDPMVVAYFEPFEEPERSSRAFEALKVGVIALQTACPTLDTQIVKDQFAEMQQDFGKALTLYFADKHGVVPKSLNDAFGDKGSLSQFFQRYFDPDNGKVARLMDGQIGPTSKFARLFDPKNKDGVISTIEDKVKQLVETKLNEVLNEFSLDEDGSAMNRLKAIIDASFIGLREALGVKAGRAEEAKRGHIKGIEFEKSLYEFVAEMGRQFGDETEFVRGTPGINKCKTGDHLITLGETCAAPGLKIVVEAKDQKYTVKEAIAELQEAKKNRAAEIGVFAFAKGCEPVEFGNFARVANDFFCTADKEAIAGDEPLLFLHAAYELARVQAVTACRKEAGGKLDVERIQRNIDGIVGWVQRLGEIVTKAKTVQNSGNAIECAAREIKDDIDRRTTEVLALLRADPT